MPGRIRTPVGLFLYRVWCYGFHPRRWRQLLRKAIRAAVPLSVRAPVGRFIWTQREQLRRRGPSSPAQVRHDPITIDATIPDGDRQRPIQAGAR